MSTPFDNAIAYAQFQLKGGVQSLLILSGLVGVGIAALMLLTTQAGPAGGVRVLSGWVSILLVIQACLLLLVGASQVSQSVKKDIASGMIESHRLMPTPPIHAVCGYIVGGCSILLGVCGVVLVAGLAAQWLTGGPISYWLLANGLLLAFAAFSWCLVLFSALFRGGTGLLVGLMVVGLWLSGGQLLQLLPAAAVLAGPLLGPSAFDPQLVHQLAWPFGVSLLAQGAVGSIFLRAAARRFRDDVTPPLGVAGGLLLLLTWCVITAIGAQWREAFAPTWLVSRSLTRELVAPETVSIVSVASVWVVALPLLASAAAIHARWVQRCRDGDPWLPRRPLHPLASALACVALLAALLLVPAIRLDLPAASLGRWLAESLAVVLLMTAAASLPSRAEARRGLLMFLVLLLSSALPILADLVRHASSSESRQLFTSLSAASPVGVMLALYNAADIPIAAVDGGIVVSLALAVVLLAWAELRRRRTAVRSFAVGPTDR